MERKRLANALDLPYRKRLAMTMRRAAELCERVGAPSSASLFRKSALELDRVDREYREVFGVDEDDALVDTPVEEMM